MSKLDYRTMAHRQRYCAHAHDICVHMQYQHPTLFLFQWQFATIRGTPSLLRAALTATTPQARLLQIPICHELLARELVLDQEGDGEKICQMEAGKMGAEFLTSLPSSLNNMEALRKLSLVDWPLKNHR